MATEVEAGNERMTKNWEKMGCAKVVTRKSVCNRVERSASSMKSRVRRSRSGSRVVLTWRGNFLQNLSTRYRRAYIELIGGRK